METILPIALKLFHFKYFGLLWVKHCCKWVFQAKVSRKNPTSKQQILFEKEKKYKEIRPLKNKLYFNKYFHKLNHHLDYRE